MTKDWEKYINKNLFKEEIKTIIKSIEKNELQNYEVIKLNWYKNYFRIRKWKIRIVFIKKDTWNEIVAVDTRWNIYKWL